MNTLIHRLPATFVTMLLTVLLAGCGLHLRGTSSAADAIADKRIHLDGGQTQTASEVRDILAASGIKMVRNAKAADYSLRLAGERITRDVLSVSPQTGKVEEFQLNYVVLLTLVRTASGEAILERVPVTLQRDFTFDQDAVLGNFSEEEILRGEMEREAAEQVVRRASAAITRDAPATR